MSTGSEFTRDRQKELAGQAAARLVADGMVVGLGTGSTTAKAIAEIGRRIREEDLHIRGIPTSYAAERLARSEGVPLTTFEDVEAVDIAIDGADEVDPDLHLIKGRGAAHTRERIVAHEANEFVVVVDASKIVDKLGSSAPVPVEVVPMATAPVSQVLSDRGAQVELRMGKAKDGPVVTDQGLWVIDASFDGIDNPGQLATELKLLPGVLDHGLFVGLAAKALIGTAQGEVEEVVAA